MLHCNVFFAMFTVREKFAGKFFATNGPPFGVLSVIVCSLAFVLSESMFRTFLIVLLVIPATVNRINSDLAFAVLSRVEGNRRKYKI